MYLYGASGHAKVILDILESCDIRIEGLIDDNPEVTELLGYPVFHQLPAKTNLAFVVSIGNNEIRKRIVAFLTLHDDPRFPVVRHPSAIVSKHASVGEGTVIMQGAVVQSCSSLGSHCIINTGASVDHDCRIGDFVHISPHATLCGNVTIGDGSWIGAGAVVLPGITVGKNTIVGAGSVVIRDIGDNQTVYGNPCK